MNTLRVGVGVGILMGLGLVKYFSLGSKKIIQILPYPEKSRAQVQILKNGSIKEFLNKKENLHETFLEYINEKHIELIDASKIVFDRRDFIGKGSFSRVYKGKWLKSDVAIKEYIRFNIYDNLDESNENMLNELINSLILSFPKVIAILWCFY